jgi:hypothetical protein
MNLTDITGLLLTSISTLNTIDEVDAVQHANGFRACIGSICVEVSTEILSNGEISPVGLKLLSNCCDYGLAAINASAEGLSPFVDGVYDAYASVKALVQDETQDCKDVA